MLFVCSNGQVLGALSSATDRFGFIIVDVVGIVSFGAYKLWIFISCARVHYFFNCVGPTNINEYKKRKKNDLLICVKTRHKINNQKWKKGKKNSDKVSLIETFSKPTIINH